MSNKANQGRHFEEMLEYAFGQCGPDCTVVKTTAPVKVISWPRGDRRHKGTFTGCFEKKGTCDFEGGFHGIAVCLEAKETSKDHLLWDAIKAHQWDRMESTAECFVALWIIEADPPCAVPISTMVALEPTLEAYSKSIPFSSVQSCEKSKSLSFKSVISSFRNSKRIQLMLDHTLQ